MIEFLLDDLQDFAIEKSDGDSTEECGGGGESYFGPDFAAAAFRGRGRGIGRYVVFL